MIFTVTGKARVFVVEPTECDECGQDYDKEYYTDKQIKEEVHSGTPGEAVHQLGARGKSIKMPGRAKYWISYWITKPNAEPISDEEFNRRAGAPELISIEPLTQLEQKHHKERRQQWPST